jgi:hypothetical protein
MYRYFYLNDTAEGSCVNPQSMLLPIMEERTAGASVGDAIIKTISSRIAGGRKELNKEPSRVRPLYSYFHQFIR